MDGGGAFQNLVGLVAGEAAVPDKLSGAWAALSEPERTALGANAIDRITIVMSELQYDP